MGVESEVSVSVDRMLVRRRLLVPGWLYIRHIWSNSLDSSTRRVRVVGAG